jgi:streptogrisin D
VIQEHPKIAHLPAGTSRFHRVITAAALTALLAGALLAAPNAQAAPTPTPTSTPTTSAPADDSDVPVTGGISGNDAQALADSLGETRTGGVYLNDDGRMVVTVTDPADAQAISDAGGVPQVVTYSTAKLNSIHTELDTLAGKIPSSSWGVDTSTNQVSVELDSAVSAADAKEVEAVTGKYGDAVRVERIPGELETLTASTGGESIENSAGKGKCSLGFNVANSAGTKYFLTAGHCVTSDPYWYQSWSGWYLGYNYRHSYPGDDFDVVKYDGSVVPYGTVHHDQQQITNSRYAKDGESVSRAGGVSNDMIGKVLVVSTTATYGDGKTVYGVIKTSNCGKRGDSGGPLYHGTTALGLTSGGNRPDEPCNDNVSDHRTYYQPVQNVLSYYGLHVY